MSFLDHLRACNSIDFSDYRDFLVAGVPVGHVRHALAERLAQHADLVAVTEGSVSLLPQFVDYQARTAALDALVDRLVTAGLVPRKRGELYPVLQAWGQPPLMAVDRAAVNSFGMTAYGIHVNGFFRGPDGPELWIARRSSDRTVAPGKLDNMIAGGQPVGLSLAQNLIKEAYEEAAVGPALASRAVPVGVLTYRFETAAGCKADCLFIYDLELDAAFVPRNTDGEVESFERMPWTRVAGIVDTSDAFKFNCNLVIVDFLIRHGLLRPDHADYLALASGLRSWHSAGW